MFWRATTLQSAPDGGEDTTAKDWKTWPDGWSHQARKAFENGYNVHDDKTPLLALRKEWIWWLLDWCDTWPFEKKGECIHSTSRKSFSQELKKCYSAQNLQSNTHKIKKGKQPWASVGKNEMEPWGLRNGVMKCGSIERNQRYGGERNARADRELAPKGDMENDRRKWEWPLQVAQGTGVCFWLGLEKTNCLAWGTSWQSVCVWCVKGTDWMIRRGSSDSGQTVGEMKEVAFSTWLKNCDSTAAEAL